MLIKNIPETVHKRIKNLAAKSEMTMNAYMIRLMKENVTQQRKSKR
jgi:predicted HicB family RNase H-like nuclease